MAPREELIRYAISSNYDLSSLESIILKGATHILFRDKDSRDITKKAREFIENLSSNKSIKKLLHSEYLLAKELGFDGVHFSSKDFDKIVLAKKLNLLVVVSTHNDKEIKLAIKNGADMICYSPIFKTPNKGKAKGISHLKRVVDSFNIPIIALGGVISEKEVEEIKKSNSAGFASIRYFS